MFKLCHCSLQEEENLALILLLLGESLTKVLGYSACTVPTSKYSYASTFYFVLCIMLSR